MALRNFLAAALVAEAVFVWAKPASAQSSASAPAEIRVNLPATLFTPPALDDKVQPTPPPPTADVAPAEFQQTHKASLLAAALAGLYVSTAVFQALDVRSTYVVIARGGSEGNPVMAGVVSNKPAFIALKAGIAVSTIVAARQLAKHNKVAAVFTMVAVTSVYATVVAHNFNLANQLR